MSCNSNLRSWRWRLKSADYSRRLAAAARQKRRPRSNLLLDIQTEDQEHTRADGRRERVMAAVSSIEAVPIHGCEAYPLGMRYRLMAPYFAERYFQTASARPPCGARLYWCLAAKTIFRPIFCARICRPMRRCAPRTIFLLLMRLLAVCLGLGLHVC